MKLSVLAFTVVCSAAMSSQAGAHDMAGMQHGSGAEMSIAPEPGATRPVGVTASSCWIRLLPAGVPAGGYLKVKNEGEQPVTLTGIHADAYGMAMLHQTTTDKENRSTMAMVHDVEIGPGKVLELSPGGFHIMLEKPKQSINVGDVLPVSLLFKGGKSLDVQCSVKPAHATSP